MKKGWYVLIASLFLFSLSVGSAMSQDQMEGGDGDFELVSSGVVEANEDGEAVLYATLRFYSHYNSYAIKVDWDRNLRWVYTAVRDNE